MEATDKKYVEITDPDAVRLIIELGALQKGDWVRFDLTKVTVGIPVKLNGTWHQLEDFERLRIWRTASNWVFAPGRDPIIDGWRRYVDEDLG